MNTGAPLGFHSTKAFTSQQSLENLNWFFGVSDVMQTVRGHIQNLEGKTDTVLLQGPEGIGKSLLGRLLHDMSGVDGNFISMDVSAIPLAKFEPELARMMQNTLYNGHMGTLYLEGLESLPVSLQQRFVQHYQSSAKNSSVTRAPRLICAVHQELNPMLKNGVFSEKIVDVLKPHTLIIQGLEQRQEDIPLMAQHLTRQYSPGGQKKLSKDAIKTLTQAHWPMQMRQLKHVLQNILATSERHILGVQDVQPFLPKNLQAGAESTVCLPHAAQACLTRYFESLRGMAPAPDLFDRIMGEVEKPLLEHVLKYVRGNQLRAAEVLGINRNTLRKKIRHWQIDAKKLDG